MCLFAESLVLAFAVMLSAGPGYQFSLSKMLGAGDKQEFKTFKVIHPAGLKTLMAAAGGSLYIFDANVSEIRARFGVILNAKLLGSRDYDLSILPADKDAKLVFYCANTKCMASHEAARRALKAGYTDVSVMVDGIVGWKLAHEQTAPAGRTTHRE